MGGTNEHYGCLSASRRQICGQKQRAFRKRLSSSFCPIWFAQTALRGNEKSIRIGKPSGGHCLDSDWVGWGGMCGRARPADVLQRRSRVLAMPCRPPTAVSRVRRRLSA